MRPLTWVCLRQAARLMRLQRLVAQQGAVIETLVASNDALLHEADHEANRADALYLIADRNQRDQVLRILEQLAELPEVGA